MRAGQIEKNGYCPHEHVYFQPIGATCWNNAQAEWCADCGRFMFWNENGEIQIEDSQIRKSQRKARFRLAVFNEGSA